MNLINVKNYLATLICDAMYMEKSELDEEELFSDFGLESMTLVKILDKINQRYNCNIKIEKFLEHPTLNEASTFILIQINR